MAWNLSANGDGADMASSPALPFNTVASGNAAGWTIFALVRQTAFASGSNTVVLLNSASGGNNQNYSLSYAGPGSNTGMIGGSYQASGDASATNIYTGGTQDRTAQTVAWRFQFLVSEPIRGNGVMCYTAPINGAVRRECYGAGPGAGISPAGILHVGNFASNQSQATTQFKGDVAYVGIVARALTKAEMMLMAQGQDIMTDIGLVGGTTSGTVLGYWKFGSGTTATDLSGNGRTATATGTGVTTVADPTFASSGTVAVCAPNNKDIFTRNPASSTGTLKAQVVYTGQPSGVEFRVVKHGGSSAGAGTVVVNWTGVASALPNAPTGRVIDVFLPGVPLAQYNGAACWDEVQVRANNGVSWTEVLDYNGSTTNKDRWGFGLNCWGWGQSNQSRMYQIGSGKSFAANEFVVIGPNGFALGAYDGGQAFTSALFNTAKCPIRVIMTAVGGSAMLGGTDADWSGNGDGSLWGLSRRLITTCGGGVDVAVGVQGEAEAGGNPITDGGAAWKAALTTLRGRLNAHVGRTDSDLPFILGVINANTGGVLTDNTNYVTMRQAQIDWVKNAVNAKTVSLTDTAIIDTIHTSALDSAHVGYRMAQQALYLLGFVTKESTGPRLKSIAYSGRLITTTVQHDTAGTLLTLRGSVASVPTDQKYYDETAGAGTETLVPVGAMSINSSNSFQVTATRDIVGVLKIKVGQQRAITDVILLSTSTPPVSVTNGQNVVRITVPNHGRSVGDAIGFSGYSTSSNVGPATVGGQAYGGGSWTVTGVVDSNTLDITLTTSATSTTTGGTSPQLAFRALSMVYDNSTPGGDTVGNPLQVGSITTADATPWSYDSGTLFVAYGTSTQLAAAGLQAA